jgi:hypothetical protein
MREQWNFVARSQIFEEPHLNDLVHLKTVMDQSMLATGLEEN